MTPLELQVHRLQAELTDERAKLRSLNFDGGGGTSDGMSAWQQAVETRLGDLHKDVRQVLYALVAAFLLLAAGGIALYAKLDDRLRYTETAIIRVDSKIDVQAERSRSQDDKLDAILHRLPAAPTEAP